MSEQTTCGPHWYLLTQSLLFYQFVLLKVIDTEPLVQTPALLKCEWKIKITIKRTDENCNLNVF